MVSSLENPMVISDKTREKKDFNVMILSNDKKAASNTEKVAKAFLAFYE